MKKPFSITTIIAFSLAVVGVAKATLLGVNVTPPIIVYANTGSFATSYNSGSQIFTVTTTPSTIKFTATEPTFSILTPRSMQIRVQVDNTGALVGGVAGPDLVISGRVQRIVGTVTNTYIGLLLTGEVTAFGYQDSGTTVDNYDFRFTPTGGLLLPFFQCDHIGVTLVSEVSTFTGLFTTNFNGQSKGNVGLEDQIPPTITCPFDNFSVTNVECSAQGGQAGAYVTFPDPVASDNCDTNVLITCAPTNGSFFALAPGTNMTSTLVTCVAKDASGNTNSCSFTVTVIDNLSPEFDSNPVLDACQANALVLSTDTGSCAATFTFPKPTATDSCCTSSVPVSVSAIDENGFIIPLSEFTSNAIVYVTGQFPQTCTRSNVVTSTANDGRGNSAQEQCFLYVLDTEPPVITCPSNQTVSCTNGPVFYPEPLASDNCTNLTVSCTPSNGSFFAIGSYTITCVASDGCGGNTNSCSFTLSVVDTTPPTISCPTNVTVECGQSTDPSNTGTATASDDCDFNPTVTFTDSTSGTCPVITHRTWYAVDASGNTNQCTQLITVNDTTAPTITGAPTGSNLGCNPTNLPTDVSIKALVTATDNCGTPTINVGHVDTGTACAPSRTFTITASDSCGNTSTPTTVAYTWTADTAAPTVTVPAGGNLGCNPTTLPTDASVKALVTATDNCGTATVYVSHVDGGTACAPSRTFTVTATDGCNNSSAPQTVSYTWTADTTAPTITAAPTGSNLGCNPTNLPTDVSIKALVTATDNCGTPTINVGHVDGGTVCAPSRTFTITASDSCGNTSTPTTVAYTWTADTTAPTITSAPTGSNLGCNPTSLPTDSSVKALVTATDNCGTATINVSHVDGGTTCAPTRTFTITATDGCNNTSAPTTVIYSWAADTTAPTVTVPTGSNLGCNPTTLPTVASVKALITVSDNCSVTATNVSYIDTTNACTITRTFTVTASDACNTSSPKTVVYTWTADTTAPTITVVPTGGNLGCNPTNLPTDVSVKALVTATDNCSAPVVTVTHVDGGTACAPTRTFTVNAIDACNNPAAPKTVVYTWTVDTTGPSVTVPAGGDLGCSTNNLPTDASVKALVTVSDTCSAVTTTVTHVDTNINCRTTRTFTVTATDACNNTTIKTVAYTFGCAPCQPFEFNFQGNTALSGAVANVRSFVTNGVSVKVTAWSRTKSGGVWQTAYLGSYAGGLGVTDSSEGDGSGNRHTVDNIDRDNYVLFEFSQPVVLDKAFLGYVVTDSDLKLWIGTFTDPYNNHMTLSDAVLNSFGYSETNMTTTNTTRWADVNAGATLGNAIVIAALPGVAETNDQFKIALFDVCKPVCQPLTIGCVTNTTGQVGVYYSSAAVASGGVPPYTFSLYSGNVPPGLSGNPSAGTLFGTPTTAGTYTFVEQVTDSTGATVLSGGCTITIAPACSASICGSVFLDCDGNGDLNGNEPGLSNSVVTLKTTTGTTLATATTTANGGYCFFNLSPGTYVLSNAPTSFVQSGGTCTNHWSDSSGRDCWYDLDHYSHFRVLGTNCWAASDGYTHWQDLSTGLDTWKDGYGIKHTQTCYTSCDKITKTNTITVVIGTCQNKTGVNFAQKAVAPKITCTVTAPATAKYGSTITYTCVVTNSGNACFSKGCKVTIWGGDITCPNLQPGQSCTVTKTHTCPTSGSSVGCSVTAYGYHPTGTVTGSSSCSTTLSW